MEKQVVEFKVEQKGKRWEDISAHTITLYMNWQDAYEIATMIAKNAADQGGREVRFELNQSGQGHYMMPSRG